MRAHDAVAAAPSTRARLAPRLIFRLHGWLGLILGVFLSLMGVSGAMMSFEDDIMLALSPQSSVHAPNDAVPLPLGRLIDGLERLRPEDRLVSLQVEYAPDRAWTAAYSRPQGGRNQRILLDPYSGRLQSEATGAQFFETVRSLHRYLTPSGQKGGLGQAITGISALGLVFFALSGLYLRLCQGSRTLKEWLRPDFRLRGAALCRMLHRVAGVWLMTVYLVIAASGLWWSYDSYRQGLTELLAGRTTRQDTPARIIPGTRLAPEPKEVDWDAAWRLIQQRYGDGYQSVLIFLPPPGKNIRIRVLPRHAANPRAADELMVTRRGQAIMGVTPYADLTPGHWILGNMDPIHTGMAFGLTGRVLFALASLAMPVFFITGLLMYLRRRREPPPHGMTHAFAAEDQK